MLEADSDIPAAAAAAAAARHASESAVDLLQVCVVQHCFLFRSKSTPPSAWCCFLEC